MKPLMFKRNLIPRLNQDGLQKRLEAVFPGRFKSITCAGDEMTFVFETVEDGDEARLLDELENHDPDVLTPHQTRMKERAAAYARLRGLDVAAMKARLDGKAQSRDAIMGEILDALDDLKALLYSGSE